VLNFRKLDVAPVALLPTRTYGTVIQGYYSTSLLLLLLLLLLQKIGNCSGHLENCVGRCGLGRWWQANRCHTQNSIHRVPTRFLSITNRLSQSTRAEGGSHRTTSRTIIQAPRRLLQLITFQTRRFKQFFSFSFFFVVDNLALILLRRPVQFPQSCSTALNHVYIIRHEGGDLNQCVLLSSTNCRDASNRSN